MSDEPFDLLGNDNNIASTRQIMQGKDKIIFVQDVVCSYDSVNDRPYLAVNFVNSILYGGAFAGLPVVNRALPTGGITHYQYVLVEQFNKLCEINRIAPVAADKIAQRAKSDQDSKSHLFRFNGKREFAFMATIVPDQLVLKDPKLAVQPYLGGWVALDTARAIPSDRNYNAKDEYDSFKAIYDEVNVARLQNKEKDKKKVRSRQANNNGLEL